MYAGDTTRLKSLGNSADKEDHRFYQKFCSDTSRPNPYYSNRVRATVRCKGKRRLKEAPKSPSWVHNWWAEIELAGPSSW